MQTDGAARGNPGPAGIGGFVFVDGQLKDSFKAYIGQTTNNVAEYRALLEGLKLAQKYKAAAVKVLLDSELVVRQLLGVYKVKNAGLKPYYLAVKELLKDYKQVEVEHIYREENKEADALANEAINEGVRPYRCS